MDDLIFGRVAKRLLVAVFLTAALLAMAGVATAQNLQGFSLQIPYFFVGGNIASGPDGNLWIVGGPYAAPAIFRVTPAGNLTSFDIATAFRSLGVPVFYSAANDIVAGSDGNLWFDAVTVDTTSNGHYWIVRMTPAGTMTPYELSAVDLPELAAGPDGNVWFSNRAAGKIGRITPAGMISEFALPIEQSTPTFIAAGPEGDIWFFEEGTRRFGKMSTDGVLLAEYATPTPTLARGLTLGPDGNLWFTDAGSEPGLSCCGRIGRLSPSGTVTEFSIPFPQGGAPGTVNRLGKIATGPDGNLWFTEGGRRRSDEVINHPPDSPSSLGRITPFGVLTELRLPFFTPAGITAGPDGNLWFAADGAVGKLTMSGSPFLSLELGTSFVTVTVSWKSPDGVSGLGQAVPITSKTGAFWFFSPDNLELVVKVLDGRSTNGHFWVFYGALSNVEYTITVTDTQTGAVKTYFNPQGQLASVADTGAF